MQRPSPRSRSQPFFKARYAEKCVTQVYRDLYRDAMLQGPILSENLYEY